MENNNYGKLFKNFNFSDVKKNPIIENKVKECIDFVLRNDEHKVNIYLCKLKEDYKFDNYMYILESIGNYLVGLFNITYKDYAVDRDYHNIAVLSRIKARYDNVMSIYSYNLENNNIVNKNFKNNNDLAFRKQNKFVKRKIYTNDLKRSAN